MKKLSKTFKYWTKHDIIIILANIIYPIIFVTAILPVYTSSVFIFVTTTILLFGFPYALYRTIKRKKEINANVKRVEENMKKHKND